MALRVFGLTGGIGSGKSTVGAHFRARGLPVVDADELAREVVRPGAPALAEIAREFGDDVIDSNGELDRKRLADRVFANEALRQKLNAITHPRVRELSVERFGELDTRGEPLACYEVPLLFESRLEGLLAPVVVVRVDEATQVARTVSRDGCSTEHARSRIAAQMPLAEKAARADFVIDNSGSLAGTLGQADEVLRRLCERFGVDPARYGLA
ncbi:MAG: dephospho-CoA kinase [Polyangiaceae bacterium]